MVSRALALVPTTSRRVSIAARVRAAFQNPGLLIGLASLAMLGGGPMPTITAAEQR